MSRLPLTFVHGCRSGSTLLMQLLAQNPANHCTPTNDLALLFANVQNQWTAMEGFRAQGLESLVPRMRGAMRGLLTGFYADEFATGRAVFDKSRDWLKQIELVEEVLEQRATVIVCIRDIRDMVASLETLYRKDQITKPSRNVEQQINGQTCEDRCKQYLAKDAMLGMFISSIKDCFEKQLDDRLIIVPYHVLVTEPRETIAKIHADCGLAPFFCNPSNVENVTHENDEVHGRPFHVVRPTVDTSAVGRWQTVLPPDVAAWLDAEYPSVQQLAHGPYRSCRDGKVPHADVA